MATGSLAQPLATCDQLAAAPLRRPPSVGLPLPESSSERDPDEQQQLHSSAADSSVSTDSASEAQHCVILMRGVVWRSEEVQVMNLLQNLLRFWPVTFAEQLVTPAGALQAHGGTHNHHQMSLTRCRASFLCLKDLLYCSCVC